MKKRLHKYVMIAIAALLLSTSMSLAAAAADPVRTIDAFLDDQANWVSNQPEVPISNGVITAAADNTFVGYKGQQLENEFIEFRLKIEHNGAGWVYIGLGDYADNALFDEKSATYGLFIQREGTLALSKWKGGVGQGDLINSLISKELIDGEFHTIQFGTFDTDEGVKIVMNVDGKKALEVVDAYADRFVGPKYFTILGENQSRFTLAKVNPDAAPATNEEAAGAAGEGANAEGGQETASPASTPAAANPKTADSGIALYAIAAALGAAALVLLKVRRQARG